MEDGEWTTKYTDIVSATGYQTTRPGCRNRKKRERGRERERERELDRRA